MQKWLTTIAALLSLASCHVSPAVNDVLDFGVSIDFDTTLTPDVDPSSLDTINDPGVPVSIDVQIDTKAFDTEDSSPSPSDVLIQDQGVDDNGDTTNPDDTTDGTDLGQDINLSDTLSDTINLDVQVTPDASDASAGNDTSDAQDTLEDIPPVSTAWQPCDNNDDCVDGPCVPTGGGKICSIACDQPCPEGFACKALLADEPEGPKYCVDTMINLCRPCSTDTECKSYGGGNIDSCSTLPETGESFCLRNCAQANCPEGTICTDLNESTEGADLRCVPFDGTCTCAYWAWEIFCVDGDSCTADLCEGSACSNPITEGPCDDGNPCSTNDSCVEGTCVGEGTVDCDDENACTLDSCDEEGACTHTEVFEGSCDDGDACTVNDTCTIEGCKGTPSSNGHVQESIELESLVLPLSEILDPDDEFGRSCTNLGDIDGDGSLEIMVGAHKHNSSTKPDVGAVWLLSVNSDGAVTNQRLISENISGFSLPNALNQNLSEDDRFGASVTSLGDFRGNGNLHVAVGAPGTRVNFEYNSGAFWIIELTSNGDVVSSQQFHKDSPGLDQTDLSADDLLGAGMTSIGDLDNNGFTDLVVGAPKAGSPIDPLGAAWVLYMGLDEESGNISILNTVKFYSDGTNITRDFGIAITFLGDINGDEINEIAVGSPRHAEGYVTIYSIPNGEVPNVLHYIGDGLGNFTGDIGHTDRFGIALSNIGDINADGSVDLAIGAVNDDGQSNNFLNVGATWLTLLNGNDPVTAHQKVTKNMGGFNGNLISQSGFGSCITPLGDLNQDGYQDLLVGAFQGGTNNRGQAWVLFLGNDTCSNDPEEP